MEATSENKKYIRQAFNEMRNKEDFLSLINYVKKIIYSKKDFPIELRQLNYYSNPKKNKEKYKQFIIKKKSGTDRLINAPISGLKSIQKCLSLIFQTIFEVSISANGFVPGRSIIDNAQMHVGNNYVYNLDLKDFFPSIDQARIWGRLKSKPFNLIGERQIIGNMISSLCCTQLTVNRLNSSSEWISVEKNVLPQGAPTSPVMSNIICGQLDFYLTAVAKRFNLKYSRYADDITFSSMHNVYQENSDFIKEVQRIINSQGFHLNLSKTRLQKRGYRQEVTGLTVNLKVNINKKYLNEIRSWIYKWESYGYSRTNHFYNNKYKIDNSLKFEKPLKGKLNFLSMIKGSTNKVVKSLENRLEILNTIKDILNNLDKNSL